VAPPANLANFVWPGDVAAGTYTFFMAFARPGTPLTPTVDQNTLMGVPASSVTFSP
jgi:hypothetical protein